MRWRRNFPWPEVSAAGAGDALVAGAALWTLVANVVYLRGGSLVGAVGVWVVLWGAGVLACRRRGLRCALGLNEEGVEGRAARGRMGVVLAGVLTIVAWGVTGSYLALWGGAMVVGLAGLLRAGAHGETVPGRKRRTQAIVPALAVVAAALALMVRSWSVDDAYYLSRAAQLAENPFAAMPATYALFGDAAPMPFPYPTFPLTAYHDFIGALAWLTGFQPLSVASFVCAPLAAALVPAAYAALLRRVLPNVWPWALGAAMALLLIEGTGERFVSQFALPRIWQGKSIVLHVVLPLAMVWGYDVARRGDWRDALRLSAVLVAGVGLNSMAVWAGPVAAGVGWLAGATFGEVALSRKRLGSAAMVVGAAWYPIGIGALYAGASEGAVGYRFEPPVVAETLRSAFGSARVEAVWVAMALLAPGVAPHAGARALSAAGLLIVFGVLLNPWLASPIAERVTSGVLYWRVVWLLPLLPAAASVLCAGFNVARTAPLGRVAGPMGVVAGLLIYMSVVPEHAVVSRGNRVGLGWPTVKAPAGPWRVARELRRRLPADTPVFAPTSVSWLLPTMTHAPAAVVPRPIAVEHAFARQLGNAGESAFRLRLADYLAGRNELDAVHLSAAIRRYRPGAIVVRAPAKLRPSDDEDQAGHVGSLELDALLTAEGYRPSRVDDFNVWLRDPAPRASETPAGADDSGR